MAALRLRMALRRGALVAAANWPLVIVEFAGDSLYKAALGVPIVGGAVMVAALVGDDLGLLLSQGLRTAAGVVLTSLFDAPIALVAFLAAAAVMACGGAVIMFLTKAGTVAVIVAGDRNAPEALNTGSIRLEWLKLAGASNLEVFLGGVRTFGRRFVSLGVWLIVTYVVTVGGYFAILVGMYQLAERTEWISAFPLGGLLATSALVVALASINVVYVLMQLIIVSDDCGPRQALRRLRIFLLHDIRHVAGLFGVILTIVILGTAASLLATAGLGLVAWVPLFGLAVFPLQAAAWLVRGLVFQLVDMTALAAYLAQYRRFVEIEDA